MLEGVVDPPRRCKRIGSDAAGEDDCKLIATESIELFRLSDDGPGGGAQELDAIVASLMAVPVVDMLEPVEVEHEQADPLFRSGRFNDRFEVFVKRAVIVNTGQAVRERHVSESLELMPTRLVQAAAKPNCRQSGGRDEQRQQNDCDSAAAKSPLRVLGGLKACPRFGLVRFGAAVDGGNRRAEKRIELFRRDSVGAPRVAVVDCIDE